MIFIQHHFQKQYNLLKELHQQVKFLEEKVGFQSQKLSELFSLLFIKSFTAFFFFAETDYFTKMLNSNHLMYFYFSG